MKILVITSGGSAPGSANFVSAVVEEATRSRHQVFLIDGGPESLIRLGIKTRLTPVDTVELERCLHTGQAYPAFSRPANIQQRDFPEIARILSMLDVGAVILLGGDGSSCVFYYLSPHLRAQGIRSALVGKTIDSLRFGADDDGTDSLGFHSAVTSGSDEVSKFLLELRNNEGGKMFLLDCMGRDSGLLTAHLALAKGIKLFLLPEEFSQGLSLTDLIDWFVMTIVKCVILGQKKQVVLIAEGVRGLLKGVPLLLEEYEIRIGDILAHSIKVRLKELGLSGNELPSLDQYRLGHQTFRGVQVDSFDAILAWQLGEMAVRSLSDTTCMSALVYLSGNQAVYKPWENLSPEEGVLHAGKVELSSPLYQALATRRLGIGFHSGDLYNDELTSSLVEFCRLEASMWQARFRKAARIGDIKKLL